MKALNEFGLDFSKRLPEPEEVISSDEAVKYGNRVDSRVLISKLIAYDVSERFGVNPSTKVLEIACGSGELARDIYNVSHCELLATDGSPELIEIASRRHAGIPVRFAAENLHQHSGKGEFDVIACKDSFHHFPDPAMALREMVSLAKPGGKIYIFDLCREATETEVLERLGKIRVKHEQMRFLRSLNASLTTAEFREAALQSGKKLTIAYPLQFSEQNLKTHAEHILSDTTKEYKLHSLFSVYILE